MEMPSLDLFAVCPNVSIKRCFITNKKRGSCNWLGPWRRDSKNNSRRQCYNRDLRRTR